MNVLVTAAFVAAAPAAALHAACAGRSCAVPEDPAARAPFCSLPSPVRNGLAAGFREGRSPDILGVTHDRVAGVTGATGRTGLRPPWPRIEDAPPDVPVVFAGAGVVPGSLPEDAGLDDVAPTIATLLEYERPHPEVRSGAALPVGAAERPRLVVIVAWKGIDARDLARARTRWPVLAGLADGGVSGFAVSTGSLPADPAATLTTIGTGGSPRQHGITGTMIRGDDGRIVRAWERGAPVSVIATLAEDLDESMRQRSQIGLVASSPRDRGLIGGEWYVEHDRDPTRFVPAGDAARTARGAIDLLQDHAMGRDPVPDILAVVATGSLPALDRALGKITSAAEEAARGRALLVVVGTGGDAAEHSLPARRVVRSIERGIGGVRVVAATAAGGIFVDRAVMARGAVDPSSLSRAARDATIGGRRIFADVFPAIAVSLARYC